MTELFRLYDRVIVKRRIGDKVIEFNGEIRSKPCLETKAAQYEVLLDGDVDPVRVQHDDVQLAGERQAAWVREVYRHDQMAEIRAVQESRIEKDRMLARRMGFLSARLARRPTIERERAA